MQKTITTYLIALSFFLSFAIQVSAQSEKCASDDLHRYLLANDLAYKAKHDEFKTLLAAKKN